MEHSDTQTREEVILVHNSEPLQAHPIETSRMWDFIMGTDWSSLIDTDHYQPFWERITKKLDGPGAYELLLTVLYMHGTATSEELRDFMEENASPMKYPQVMVITYMDEESVSYGYMRIEGMVATRI